MADEKQEVKEVKEVKVEISLDERLESINGQYQKVVGEIKQIEEQIQKNHQQLTSAKNERMQKGLELQGQIKLLVDMGAKPKEATVLDKSIERTARLKEEAEDKAQK